MSHLLLQSSLETAVAGFLCTLSGLAGWTVVEGHSTAPLADTARTVVVDATVSAGRFSHAGIREAQVVVTVVSLAEPAAIAAADTVVAVIDAALELRNRSALLAHVAGLAQPGLSAWSFQQVSVALDDSRRRRGASLSYKFICHLR